MLAKEQKGQRKMKLPEVEKEVNRFNRVQKVLISLICILLLTGIICVANGSTVLNKNGYDAFSMLRYSLIDHPLETIKDWMKHLSSLREVQEENEELKNILSSTKLQGARVEYLEQRVAELEALMDMESISQYDKIYASVMSRDMNTWSNIITVDKGKEEGIEVDMAVVSSQGLIGKVSEVYDHSCKVKLLSTETKDVSVSIQIMLDEERSTDGILENYDSSKQSYNVQIFDANVEIKEGMKVLTSGNGGVFPSGILVGEVESVTQLYNSKGRIVSVIPSADFNDFESVAILKVK